MLTGHNFIQPVFCYGIDGYLFGREFLEIVAPRRVSFKETRAFRRRHRIKVIVAGVVITLLFATAGANLVAPVLATAYMVHVCHGMRRHEAADGHTLG